MLRHLAAGELEAAAALSNAPARRLQALRDFRSAVGEERFRELFGRYFAAHSRIVMEAAVGPHRLLVWELRDAGEQRTGQYFVEVGGSFLMDDVPSAGRAELQRLLTSLR